MLKHCHPLNKSGDDTRLGNSRIFVIASEAKQSLEILNSSLGILEFILRNSRFLLALVGQAPLLANFIRATP